MTLSIQDEALKEFLVESAEGLDQIEREFVELEADPSARHRLAAIFRAVHTVKGMAATMGYARVADLAHRAETLLDALRRGSAPVTDDILQLMFRTVDLLEKSVELSVVGREGELDVAAVAAELEKASARLAPDLKIQRALNLDGGSSSAFWFAGERGVVSIPEQKTVRDFVAVVAR